MKKNISPKALYTAIAGILFSTNLLSATYYVSPTGNDASSGTSTTTAWKTISRVNSMVLSPGTTVLFEGGKTFNGGINLDVNDAHDPTNIVTISSYGTGKAIISSATGSGFYANNTEGFTISNLIFEGSGMTTNSSDGVSLFTDLSGNIKLNKITIENIEVHNYGKTGISIVSQHDNTGFKDLLINGSHIYNVKENGIITRGYTTQTHIGWGHQNITIKNTEVNNVPGYSDPSTHRGSGIILGQVDNGLIDKCTAHDNGSGNTHCGGPGGIWAWDCNNVTIQFCESYNNLSGTGCDGLGFDLDGGMTNSVLQYNYSHDNAGAGYLLGQYDYARPWSNNMVRYNISENDGRTNSGGITLFKGSGTTMSGAKIFNNTIYTSPSSTNSGVGAFTVIDWNTGITGIEVYNNIFQSTGNVKLIDIPTGYNAYFSGNLYWASGGSLKIMYQGTTYTDIAAWRTATGNELSGTIPTGITADPYLLNAGSGGIIFPGSTISLNAYKPGSGSLAIDGGLDLMVLHGIDPGAHDFFNTTIPFGSAPDIGACETVSSITTNVVETEKSNPEGISFYPNPVSSGNPINITGAELPYSIELISMAGLSVWKDTKINSQTYTLPTKDFATGVYLLVIIDKNGKQKTSKLMIE